MNNEEKQNVMQRLLNARKHISKSPLKKEGKNKFSNYEYFTPSQITNLVTQSSIESGIIATFKMEVENGEPFGYLRVTNVLDVDDFVDFKILSAIPDIKATSSTQKLGGMVTYTQRYLEMLAFGITDNSLDLDSQDNRGEKTNAPTKKPKAKLDAKQLETICKAIESGNAKYTKDKIKESYSLSSGQIKTLDAVVVGTPKTES